METYKYEVSQQSRPVSHHVITDHVRQELVDSGLDDLDQARLLLNISDAVWQSHEADQIAGDLYGDVLHACPTKYFAEYLSQMGNRVYMYLFTYKPSFGPWAGTNLGPTLYDDLEFVFGRPLVRDGADPDEKTLSRNVIKVFSTFAKTGSVRE